MAEVIGVASGLLAFIDAACTSSKKLYALIDRYREASDTLADLATNLDDTRSTLKTLKEVLSKTDRKRLGSAQRDCLKKLEPTIKDCTTLCEKFHDKITKVTTHSKDGELSFAGKVRLDFKRESLLALKYRLESHKSTISIALLLVQYCNSQESQQQARNLGEMITMTKSSLSGQIQGLEMSLRALESRTSNDSISSSLQEHEIALQRCLDVCLSAIKAAPPVAHDVVKRLEGYDQARQLVAGSIGDVKTGSHATSVAHALAKDRASQAIVRDVGGGSVADVFGSFFSTGRTD